MQRNTFLVTRVSVTAISVGLSRTATQWRVRPTCAHATTGAVMTYRFRSHLGETSSIWAPCLRMSGNTSSHSRQVEEGNQVCARGQRVTNTSLGVRCDSRSLSLSHGSTYCYRSRRVRYSRLPLFLTSMQFSALGVCITCITVPSWDFKPMPSKFITWDLDAS